MKLPEGAPFFGEWHKIGPEKTVDSVVGIEPSSKLVIKWSRQNFQTATDSCRAAYYGHHAFHLYSQVFGEEHIITTSFIPGQKVDSGKEKYKVYIVQPYINAWSGRSAPEEIQYSPFIHYQWEQLYTKMFTLFQTWWQVNSEISENGSNYQTFPINVTLGMVRKMAKWHCESCRLPRSENLLIERETSRIRLCDWGPLSLWNNNMQFAYNQILSRSTKKF